MNCETYMRQLKLLCSEVDSQNLHEAVKITLSSIQDLHFFHYIVFQVEINLIDK